MSNFADAWRGDLPGLRWTRGRWPRWRGHAGSSTRSGHFGASSGGPA